MAIGKIDALKICHERLNKINTEYYISYNKLLLSELQAESKDYFDLELAKELKILVKKRKAILDQILYLQELPDDAIIGEEEA